MVAFFLGQLRITRFPLGTSSLSWPSILPAGQQVRWCTDYVNSRAFMDRANKFFRQALNGFIKRFSLRLHPDRSSGDLCTSCLPRSLLFPKTCPNRR